MGVTARVEALTALYVNRLGWFDIEGLRVRIGVLDAKRAFGHIRVLITPMAGTGEQWVNLDRVTLEE